jgi:hypothetical protein
MKNVDILSLSMMYSDLYTCSANGQIQVESGYILRDALLLTEHSSVGPLHLIARRLGLRTKAESSFRLLLIVEKDQMSSVSSPVGALIRSKSYSIILRQFSIVHLIEIFRFGRLPHRNRHTPP